LGRVWEREWEGAGTEEVDVVLGWAGYLHWSRLTTTSGSQTCIRRTLYQCEENQYLGDPDPFSTGARMSHTKHVCSLRPSRHTLLPLLPTPSR
jgi:hypothetical protein